MNDLQFSALINNISVILGPLEGDNERQIAMETCLLWKNSLSPVGHEPGTARSAGRHLIY